MSRGTPPFSWLGCTVGSFSAGDGSDHGSRARDEHYSGPYQPRPSTAPPRPAVTRAPRTGRQGTSRR